MEVTIDSSVIRSYAESLTQQDLQTEFHASVSRLQEVSRNADLLSRFLPAFVSSIADLFGATSVAIWFPQLDRKGIHRKIDIGWSNLRLDRATDDAHQQLAEFALRSHRLLTVMPYSAPESGSGVSNPTDSFLLFGTSQFGNSETALLEIVLGPKPLRRPHQRLMESYVDWLEWLTRLLEQGLERCFQNADQPLLLALDVLEQVADEVDAIQLQIRQRLQEAIRSLAGQNFGSLEANQAVAKQVHRVLDAKGLRVCCPECGAAAILRCQNGGNARSGSFTFDHYLESGRTFHGGQTTFPALELVAKPPRRTAKK